MNRFIEITQYGIKNITSNEDRVLPLTGIPKIHKSQISPKPTLLTLWIPSSVSQWWFGRFDRRRWWGPGQFYPDATRIDILARWICLKSPGAGSVGKAHWERETSFPNFWPLHEWSLFAVSSPSNSLIIHYIKQAHLIRFVGGVRHIFKVMVSFAVCSGSLVIQRCSLYWVSIGEGRLCWRNYFLSLCIQLQVFTFTFTWNWIILSYDNGDLKLFDLREMKLLWEKNVKHGICSLG